MVIGRFDKRLKYLLLNRIIQRSFFKIFHDFESFTDIGLALKFLAFIDWNLDKTIFTY